MLVAAAGGWLIRRLTVGGPSLQTPMALPLLALLLALIPGPFLAENRFVVFKELFMWSACFTLFLAVFADENRRTTENLAGAIAASGKWSRRWLSPSPPATTRSRSSS